MEIKYKKFHGAGNDFILIDNRKNVLKSISRKQIEKLCDRHFGIGADGLIALNKNKKADFEMVYYNADGNIGSMCGNGARCITLFAYQLGLIKKKTSFNAYDGLHSAEIFSVNKNNSLAEIKVSMSDVKDIETGENYYFLNTGSPHYVTLIKDLNSVNVVAEGRKIRYNKRFKKEGVNVNFVTIKNGTLHIRTYERGVENETLACGTGITAAAIVVHYASLVHSQTNYINVKALGGNLKVHLNQTKNIYQNIYLEGPTEMVFEGTIKI
jgi:diaminopimelate epimerase